MFEQILSFFGSHLFLGLVLLAVAIGWWFFVPWFLGTVGLTLPLVVVMPLRIAGCALAGLIAAGFLVSGVNDIVD